MPFLRSMTSQPIIVKTKWGQQFTGTLVSCDNHMNIQLAGCVEHSGTEPTALESVVIRCNNVLYIRQVPPTVDDPATLLVPA